MRRAVFLDRDGVINATVWNPDEGIFDTPYALDEFVLLPGVTTAIRRIRELGFLAVAVSNQPGVAKGKCTPRFFEDVSTLLDERLAADRASLDGAYYCVHHPEAVVPELRVVCECRKPKPGLLLQASRDLDIDLSRSWMIGDQDRDVLAGAAAGCRTIIVGHGALADTTAATLRAGDIVEAVEQITALEAAEGAVARQAIT